MTIVSVKNLTFAYLTNPVLENVSFAIEAGDFVALAGPNGAGKTTLVRLLLGLNQGATGDIQLFGKPLAKFSDWSKIGYLPQRVNKFNPLFPATVSEVVGLGFKKRGPKHKEAINRALEFLEIDNLHDRPVASLSGGQQQKVFLARALVNQPELLILDEPSSALDPESRHSFFSALKKLNQEQGVTIIMITHDSASAGDYAKKLLYLDKTLIFFDSFRVFCQSEEMHSRFGGFLQHLICHQHQD
ncbi:MAG: metal ABC transporter ATP-binding protein [Candidatus Parcubacteria bacterium]|jgi:zinc transport system ATP-binding protein|nr:MAG: ABC transporter ATP-binding protein [Candidatus Parcubacteria bacterium]